MHIAIFRSDNLGDLIHTLPLIGALKTSIQLCTITFIGRDYIKPLAGASPLINNFLSLEGLESLDDYELSTFLEKQEIDSLLMLKSHARLLEAAREAKIPHIIYQLKNYFFFVRSKKLLRCKIINANFRRGSTRIHYFQRCLKFLRAYNVNYSLSQEDLTRFNKIVPHYSTKIENLLSGTSPNILIHLGTNGNTHEWPLLHFKKLVARLPKEITIFFTGSQQEKGQFKEVLSHHTKAIDLFGALTLSELIYLLGRVDCVLANATGPLHIAAVMGTYTVGIYPAQPTIDTTRWGPIGKSVTTVSAPICKYSRKNMLCNCMSKISIEAVSEKIYQAPIFDALKHNLTCPGIFGPR